MKQIIKYFLCAISLVILSGNCFAMKDLPQNEPFYVGPYNGQPTRISNFFKKHSDKLSIVGGVGAGAGMRALWNLYKKTRNPKIVALFGALGGAAGYGLHRLIKYIKAKSDDEASDENQSNQGSGRDSVVSDNERNDETPEAFIKRFQDEATRLFNILIQVKNVGTEEEFSRLQNHKQLIKAAIMARDLDMSNESIDSNDSYNGEMGNAKFAERFPEHEKISHYDTWYTPIEGKRNDEGQFVESGSVSLRDLHQKIIGDAGAFFTPDSVKNI